MNNCSHGPSIHTRRDFLRTTGAGFGWLAFAALQASLQAAEKSRYISPLAPKPGHHPAKAKRVIFLFMNGGPSHLETFDWKPELKKVGAGGHHQTFRSGVAQGSVNGIVVFLFSASLFNRAIICHAPQTQSLVA